MKKAFTLIELVLVVIIMGVVYMFAISSLEKVKQLSHNDIPTLQNLKRFLLQKEFEKKARFVCFEECEQCSVILDKKAEETITGFFQKQPKIYRYDATLGMEQIQSEPYFDADGIQHQTCFSYTIYKDGTSDQIFVEEGGSIYDYGEYFDDVKLYDSIEEAQEKKEALLQKVLS